MARGFCGKVRYHYRPNFFVVFHLRHENDYFHEALHKRLLNAETLPYRKVLQWVGVEPLAVKFSSALSDAYTATYAIDGKISKTGVDFFHSKKEDYPWLQLEIPERYVSGVEIAPRYDCCGHKVRNIEIRAGLISVPDGFKGKLTNNPSVAHFAGPFTTGKNITINFDRKVLAKYITLQSKGQSTTLEVNEVTVLYEHSWILEEEAVSTAENMNI